MKVILADVLGYCMGVRRAIDAALECLENNKDFPVYSLGPLIHNNTTLSYLAEKGLNILTEDEIPHVEENSVVIIRAHGVPPAILEQLEKRKCTVINATCPRVLASQKNAEKFAKRGFSIILAGDRNHGEVSGIAGYAGNAFSLIQNTSEAEKFDASTIREDALLLSQTTFNPDEFEKISKILQKKIKNLKILNTICPATVERQNALLKLCPKVDGVIVAGGKNSANTKRLLLSAKENCQNAVLIENAEEIPEQFFKLQRVGITAGASTPDSTILSVKKKLEVCSSC